jgi:hypothetical protein
MKRTALILVAIAAIVVSAAADGDAVQPATLTFTNYRGEAEAQAGSVSYYRGTTILLTNCYLSSGTTTAAAPQGLSNVVIEARIGTTTSSTAYTGTVANATGGTWWVSAQVPTNRSVQYLQIKITDTNANSYIYPHKVLGTKAVLE